jgi:hypothetical protein
MAFLFRFTCKPNNPVCKGELVFLADSCDEVAANERLEWLLANGYSFAYYTTDRKLSYLGEFWPALDFPDGVITYQNGEY